MAHDDTNRTDRRTFLQAGALATAAAASDAHAGCAMRKNRPRPRQHTPDAKTREDRRRGDDSRARGRCRGRTAILRQAFANGIRLFDTAKVYGTEVLFKRWFEQAPEVRKQIFLVTKDMPQAPKDLLKMVDQRLAALGTDYIDLFFIHGLGDGWKLDKTIDFITCKEFKETADAIRKSGKAKFIGFSTHHPERAPVIQAAAEAGIVDAIMLQYAPWLDKDSPLNKALDVAWKTRRRAHLDEADRQRHVRRQAQGEHPRRRQAQSADARRDGT